MPLRSGEVFAGYTVVRQVGAGRLGAVYLAAHPRVLRQDALRVLTPAASADPHVRARFQQRVDAAATLWHPHIVGVHEHGDHDGLLWLSADFVDGADAAALLRDRYDTGLPADQVLDVVTAIADALDYAHARRCVHGDVTAASILLTAHERRILLTDFGIPRDGDTDPRHDRYGLAATAYHLLSGVEPPAFPAPVPPLAHTRQDLAAYDPALLRAMDPDPRERFGACLDFAAALRDAATSATQARRVIDPAAFAPTEHLANPTTGSGLPAVFVPAWSAEEPAPEFEPAPTFAPDPELETRVVPPIAAAPGGPRPGRIWAVAGIATLVVLIAVLMVLVTRGGGPDQTRDAAPATTGASPAAPSTTATGVGGRPRPPTVRGVDPTGEDCAGGYQITGRVGWASQGVRASPEATCTFVGNVLKAYWDIADPSRDVRTVVAAGAIPCGAGAACQGNDFVVTCSAEGTDPWITCRGGRDAVVVLY
ncbi:serine/threonine-protein kinase [Mycolicibacterium madagascariense]|nr:serine/threonine-protein kinase [Mycolicibacterium madagascariense]MCV7011907.1 protein kinase [Mycolicibacterium madagascariense]